MQKRDIPRIFPYIITGYGLAGHTLSALFTRFKTPHLVISNTPPQRMHTHYPSTAFIQHKSLTLINKILRLLKLPVIIPNTPQAHDATTVAYPITEFIYGVYTPALRRPLSLSTPIVFRKKPLGYMLNIENLLSRFHNYATTKDYQHLVIENVQTIQYGPENKWRITTTRHQFTGKTLIVAIGPKVTTLFSQSPPVLSQAEQNTRYFQGVEYLIEVPRLTYLKAKHSMWFISSHIFDGYGAWIAPAPQNSSNKTYLKVGFAVYHHTFTQRGIVFFKKHLQYLFKTIINIPVSESAWTHLIAKQIPILLKPHALLLEPPTPAFFVGDSGRHVGNLLLDGIYPTLFIAYHLAVATSQYPKMEELYRYMHSQYKHIANYTVQFRFIRYIYETYFKLVPKQIQTVTPRIIQLPLKVLMKVKGEI